MLLYVVQVYFEPDDVLACIVTCGGLCPGLNTVIREIVCGLYHMYGVKKVLGIEVSNY
jgi:6-phosphofructokinase 1